MLLFSHFSSLLGVLHWTKLPTASVPPCSSFPIFRCSASCPGRGCLLLLFLHAPLFPFFVFARSLSLDEAAYCFCSSVLLFSHFSSLLGVLHWTRLPTASVPPSSSSSHFSSLLGVFHWTRLPTASVPSSSSFPIFRLCSESCTGRGCLLLLSLRAPLFPFFVFARSLSLDEAAYFFCSSMLLFFPFFFLFNLHSLASRLTRLLSGRFTHVRHTDAAGGKRSVTRCPAFVRKKTVYSVIRTAT